MKNINKNTLSSLIWFIAVVIIITILLLMKFFVFNKNTEVSNGSGSNVEISEEEQKEFEELLKKKQKEEEKYKFKYNYQSWLEVLKRNITDDKDKTKLDISKIDTSSYIYLLKDTPKEILDKEENKDLKEIANKLRENYENNKSKEKTVEVLEYTTEKYDENSDFIYMRVKVNNVYNLIAGEVLYEIEGYDNQDFRYNNTWTTIENNREPKKISHSLNDIIEKDLTDSFNIRLEKYIWYNIFDITINKKDRFIVDNITVNYFWEDFDKTKKFNINIQTKK